MIKQTIKNQITIIKNNKKAPFYPQPITFITLIELRGEFVASNVATLPRRRINQSTDTVCVSASAPSTLLVTGVGGAVEETSTGDCGTGEFVSSEESVEPLSTYNILIRELRQKLSSRKIKSDLKFNIVQIFNTKIIVTVFKVISLFKKRLQS